jgi:hypothetical protein
MKMEKLDLTWSRLNAEYLNWSLKWGDQYDRYGQTWGQLLNRKYKMTSFRTNELSKSFISVERLYKMLLDELYNRRTK